MKYIYEVIDHPRRRFTVEDGNLYIDTVKNGKRRSSLSELEFCEHTTFGAEQEMDRQRRALNAERIEADKQRRITDAKKLLIDTGYKVVKAYDFRRMNCDVTQRSAESRSIQISETAGPRIAPQRIDQFNRTAR